MKIGKLLIAKYLVEAAPKNTVQDWVNYYIHKFSNRLNVEGIPEGLADLVYANDGAFEEMQGLGPRFKEAIVTVISELFNEGLQKYVQWTIEHSAQDKKLPEDTEQIIGLLKKFEAIKPTGKVNKDIQSYSNTAALQTALQPYMQQVDREQYYLPEGREKQRLTNKDYENLGNVAGYNVIKINTVEGATELCRHTEWCVRDSRWSEGYLKQGPLYLILEDRYKYVLVHFATEQAKDVDDNPLDRNTAQKVRPTFEALFQSLYNTKPNYDDWIKEHEKGDFASFIPIDAILNSGDGNYIDNVISVESFKERDKRIEDYLINRQKENPEGGSKQGEITGIALNYQSNFKNQKLDFVDDIMVVALKQEVRGFSFSTLSDQNMTWFGELGYSEKISNEFLRILGYIKEGSPKFQRGVFVRLLRLYVLGMFEGIENKIKVYVQKRDKDDNAYTHRFWGVILETTNRNYQFDSMDFLFPEGTKVLESYKQEFNEEINTLGLNDEFNKLYQFQRQLPEQVNEIYERGK